MEKLFLLFAGLILLGGLIWYDQPNCFVETKDFVSIRTVTPTFVLTDGTLVQAKNINFKQTGKISYYPCTGEVRSVFINVPSLTSSKLDELIDTSKKNLYDADIIENKDD